MPDFVLWLPRVKYERSSFMHDSIKRVLADAGGPTRSICTGFSDENDKLNNLLTSLYPIMLSKSCSDLVTVAFWSEPKIIMFSSSFSTLSSPEVHHIISSDLIRSV